MDIIRDFRDVLTLINLLATGVLALLLWLRKPGVDAMRQVRAHAVQQAELHQEHQNRLTKLEAHVSHMPTDEELKELEGTVKAINERTRGLAEAVSTIRATLGRIENFLLSHKP
ncbi:MAG: DUF2730 family protein [Burkholderiaceae bacterium]|nr:DUF2730 family protein [Burkholderiaceae bacterium]